MTANVMENEKCITVGEPAWHSLGENYKTPLSAKEAHDKMGGSFFLEQNPMAYWDGELGQWVEVDGRFVIVRGSTLKHNHKVYFGTSSEHYNIFQPIDIIEKFDEKVGVSISSLGFLQSGEKMFLSWELPSFEIAEDEVKLYGNVLFGFDTVFSSRLNIGTFKVVCANTFQASIAEAEQESKKNRGRGTIYHGKHTNKKLLYELGEWMEHVQQNTEKQMELTKNFFQKLVDTPIIHESQAKHLLEYCWSDPSPVPDSYPKTLREKEQERRDKEAEKMQDIRGTIFDIYSSNRYLGNDGENYWRLFNSSTQYFNHEQPSKKDTAFSITWGNRNSEMNKFAEVLRLDMEL